MIGAMLLALATQDLQAKPVANVPEANSSASTASRPWALSNPGTWVTVDDYPADAYAAGQQGSVRVTYNVDAQGRIENCQVASSSESPSLDAATCSLITSRGRYSPARDATGKAIPGPKMSMRFNWAIAPK